jgi:hypothetical protein
VGWVPIGGAISPSSPALAPCHSAASSPLSSRLPPPRLVSLLSLSSTTYPPCEQGLTAVVVVVGVGVTPVPRLFVVVVSCWY